MFRKKTLTGSSSPPSSASLVASGSTTGAPVTNAPGTGEKHQRGLEEHQTVPLPVPPVKVKPKANRTCPTIMETCMDPQLHEDFRQFLEKELAVEGLLFWDEVEAFNKMASAGAVPVTLLTEATRLFNKFIKSGADCELNLPGSTVLYLTNVLNAAEQKGEIDANIFRDAQKQALRVIADHSFPRWIQSIEWLPKLEQQEKTPERICTGRLPRPPSLAVALGSKIIHDRFKSFLDEEKASADLELWEDIEYFYENQTFTIKELRQYGKRIFDKYLSPKATNPVDVPLHLRHSLASLMYGTVESAVDFNIFRPIQAVNRQYTVWCSHMCCWEGPPLPSRNDQVLRIPGLKKPPPREDANQAPSFEVTIRHPILCKRFAEYLKALNVFHILEFAKLAEEFARVPQPEVRRFRLQPLTFKMLRVSRRISALYFGTRTESAKYPIFLPDSLRDPIRKLCDDNTAEKFPLELFVKARLWCTALIKDHYYALWLMSNEWRICNITKFQP